MNITTPLGLPEQPYQARPASSIWSILWVSIVVFLICTIVFHVLHFSGLLSTFWQVEIPVAYEFCGGPVGALLTFIVRQQSRHLSPESWQRVQRKAGQALRSALWLIP